MTKDEEIQRDQEFIRKYRDQLAEHFDSVQIFCTRVLEDGSGDTRSFSMGSGNWFARYGQVHEWMVREDQDTRNEQNSDKGEPTP